MFIKLKFKGPSSVNFQFGDVGVRVFAEATEVDDHFGEALLEQFPHWVTQTKKPKAPATDEQ